MAAAKPKSISKSEFLKSISESTEVSKKDVVKVLDAVAELVAKNIGKKGPGVIQIPGLVKISIRVRPAQPAKKGVIDPFTKKLVDRPAKPASKKVRVVPLKALKDMAK
ncbi:MAG TPA: DNA-binding protein [Planctomycetaceae bacterium]|jgi:nucleoid DNA-binding protein|nr:DNA-binding protein [Planctomycetaceae bacterium]